MVNPTIADALMDRLVQPAYHIELKGDSMRKQFTSGSGVPDSAGPQLTFMFCVAYLQLALQDTVEPSRVRQLKQFSQWVQRLSSGLVQEAPAETEITPPSIEASLRGYGDATSLRQWVPAPGCHDYLAQLQTEPGLRCLPHAAQLCGPSCSRTIPGPLSACKLKLYG